jgi:hypothetical protein
MGGFFCGSSLFQGVVLGGLGGELDRGDELKVDETCYYAVL